MGNSPIQLGATVEASRSMRVLLVDDQAIVGESVRGMLADEADVEFHFCSDPSQAIVIANRIRPTVILQDLVMPDIDGLLLVKFFRANPATRETPMIVLSSKEEPAIKAQAFALGANDYLVKLPDRLELVARVRYHSRAYLNLMERNEAFRQLAESQRHLADELAQAARYVQSLLPEKLEGDVSVDWRFVPSAQLGGDMFGYHWLDPDHFVVYLLDVSGHGVGSSLLAVSAANLLSTQSLPSTDFCDPGSVVARLNEVFQTDRQDGKYFTMFYGVYDRKERALAYCNAAHPPGLLFTGSAPPSPLPLSPQGRGENNAPLAPGGRGEGVRGLCQLEGTDPMVGSLPPGVSFETRTAAVEVGTRLLLYSDGVYEIAQPDGNMWAIEEFVEFLTPLVGKDDLMDRLYDHVRQLHGAETLNDDFSILEIRWE